ncbi:cytidylyltransferase domain-containing protein [Agromyces marinus]|uniref:cytidylyltransferase domain-containing protein n=1 Tax=Agromyces marinus TaxID=1389020 RepID=UPI00257336A5|nr:hypothetical protein [Agromyces marinus]
MIPPEEIDLLAADGNVLMVVDGDVRGVRAHLYLDQNLGADRHPWPDIARDRQLLGAQYALIRRSVVEARRPRPWNWPEREAPRLVVMLGGSDPRGLTGLVAAELARIDHDLRVTVVVPPGAREAVARRLGADPRFSLIETTPRLVDHLAAADLVVSAAGTTAWEICTLGLPAVLLAVVDNQRESLARASELGLCVGADVTERDDLGGLAESVRSLIADEPLRRRLSERCLEHFDGEGRDASPRRWSGTSTLDDMMLAVLQARCSSTRLPGKVLAPVLDRPMILRQLERIERAARIDGLVVVTSVDPSDDPLVEVLDGEGIPTRRGSLADVYSRFAGVVDEFGPEHIVRLTADCPLTDPEVIDLVAQRHLESGADYTSNALIRTFPHGLDVECVSADAFRRLGALGLGPREREHVTLGLYARPEMFRIEHVVREPDLSGLRWTVDYRSDLEFVRRVYAELHPSDPAFGTRDILALLESRPELVHTADDIGD